MSQSAEEGKTRPSLRYFRWEIRGLASHLEIEDPPLELAEQIFEQGIRIGVPVDSWSRYSAACLLAAVKLQDIPIADDRFADGARHPKKSLINTVQLISKETGLEVRPRVPEPYLEKYMDELAVSQEMRERAFEIAEEARDEVLGSGIAPTSYAAAIVYISSLECGQNLTQSDVSEVSGKSEVTIRNRYQDILEVINDNPASRKGINSEEEDE